MSRTAEPQTKIIGGNGTSVATYELDPGVFQYIESVLVEVDTSGSGDVQPTLTVQTTNGVPIADKQQDAAIDGGGAGRATWALRLGGNGAGSNTLGLHWGVNTDATALGLELNSPSAIAVNGNGGLRLTGNIDNTPNGNEVEVESDTLAAAQRVVVRLPSGRFEVVNGALDLLTMRIGNTRDVDFFVSDFFVNDVSLGGLFAIVSGAGAGTGTQVTLNNGSQFIVFDHLGNPMVAYTG